MSNKLSMYTRLVIALVGITAWGNSAASVKDCAIVDDVDARADCVSNALAQSSIDFQARMLAAGGVTELAIEGLMRDLWSEVESVMYPQRSQVIEYYVNFELDVSDPACSTYLPGTPGQTESCLTVFNAVAYGGASVGNTETLVLGICGATNTGPVLYVSGTCSSMTGIPIPYAGSVIALAPPVLFQQQSLPGKNCATAAHPPAPVSDGSTAACSSAYGNTVLGSQ